MSFCPHARRMLAPLAALALLALGGCVVAPAYGPGGYYAPGYAYARPLRRWRLVWRRWRRLVSRTRLVAGSASGDKKPQGAPLPGGLQCREARGDQCPSDLTISSVIFLASPNSIIVFGRKNSSFSTPA